MPLHIYYSDRIEDLANHLKGALVKERETADPFAFSTVVVPNTNIAKWLRIRAFADTSALCMGIEFPFIENALFELLANCLPPETRPKLLPMNAYSTGILSILLKDADESLAPFRRYIAEGNGGPLTIDSREKARMAWQLSVKLADLMDRYEVHRPDIVTNWLVKNLDAHGKPLADGSVEAAEAALAGKLFGVNGIYPPGGKELSLRQLFDLVQNHVDKPGAHARTIHFFGLSTLSSLQARILHWLAQTHRVVFYHNNVCMEYWGDIETKGERIRRLGKAHPPEEDIEIENPLLSQWGAAGRETLRLLVDLEEENDGSIDFEWKCVSSPTRRAPQALLGKIQDSILRRTSEVERIPQDATLQIAAAPGIRREVEMVYNAILGAVWKPKSATGERPWGDCRFSDIAVLVPDMATYRPVIEAVFDGRGQIPYGLIDTTASEDSAYLQGFLALMALARDGLSRESLFTVLDNPCVQRALSFGPDDVKTWRRYAKGTGAFDGFEGEDGFRNFSWGQALRRLRLGVVAEEGEHLVVWDGGDDDSALRFSSIVETLYRELAPIASLRLECAPPPDSRSGTMVEEKQTWARELRRIANEFLAVERDDKLEGPVKGQLFGTLSSLSGIRGKQGADLVVAAVEQFVGGVKCQKGSYLTNGVTIAGLQPMRPVPFKQVFVLGMGEGMFPGRDSATTLEIRGAQRTLGDMLPTAVKKYLFLETLMAVKDRLVISYPCLDPVKDAELFPSGMVCELEKFLSDYVLPTTEAEGKTEASTQFQEVTLPLLERGEPDDKLVENPVAPIQWDDKWFAGLIPTYSNVERGISRKLVKSETGTVPSGNGPEPGVSPERITIKTKELSDFLESPLRAALRYRHGIGIEGYKDDSIDPDMPLELENQGRTRWSFHQALVEKVSDPSQVAEVVQKIYGDFSIQGKLPEGGGFLGDYTIAKLKKEFEDGGSLARLHAFACEKSPDGFQPAGGTKPDPVRTVLSAETLTGRPLPERLYTGPTKNWVVSGDGTASSVLLFNKCGDERKRDGIAEAPFPPKAVLEPFVTWIAMVAGADDDRVHSLRVGIADIERLLSNAWRWTITPEAARSYLNGLTEEYLGYLACPDGDGTYLDYGYSDLTKAWVKASPEGEVGWKPKSPEDWENLADATQADDFFGGGGGFNNDLVVERSIEPLSRMPGEGEGKTLVEDAGEMERRYRILFARPMSGEREHPVGSAGDVAETGDRNAEPQEGM